MIVPLTSISKTILLPIQKDTVRIPISYIRIANQVFVERDRLQDELGICRKMNSVNANLVNMSDSVILKLEKKIENLNLIVNTTNGIHDTEIANLTKELKKSRRNNYLLGGSSALFIILLIVL
jgi:hypothetical protein